MVLWRTRVFGVASPSDPSCAGPNNKKLPRMNVNSSNPGPSGSRGPASHGRSNPIASADPPSGFACEFPGCKRIFDTKTGRGLHHRRAHSDWTDEQQNTTAIKARWSEEETRLLAAKEVELMKQGVRFLNQALLLAFPQRTLEGIKGKRKQPAYKQVVEEILAGPASPSEAEEEEVLENSGRVNGYMTAIADYIAELPRPKCKGYQVPRLLQICYSLAEEDKDVVLRDLTLYLREIFPQVRRETKARRTQQAEDNIPRRQKRREDYARTQDLWRKNRSKCLRMILDDITQVQVPPKDVMVPFWEAVMKRGDNVSPGNQGPRPVEGQLWAPITPAEIKKALPGNSTSSGPDGLSARLLKKTPLEILVRILNIIMWCGRAPAELLDSITVLIPKKSGANKPADFRPITVSSVLIRTLHKVLASRMSREIKLDQRQRAFRPTDGCSDNVFLLDLILRYHHKCHKPLFVASMDIAKAFDSVSHAAIRETLQIMGLPVPMNEYIMDVYARSTTRLYCDSWKSDKIKPECGVKQGDPMSPMIFNMVIERLLERLPKEIGARVGGVTVNAAAFADDMLLFASTPMGLQRMLNQAVDFLSGCGLQVNASKCMTVALRNVPHEKKTVVDKDTVFLCQNRELPALKRSDEWTYLGVPFTPEGRNKVDVSATLRDAIEKLTRAPLKPQQRLFAIRTMVIPGLFHKLELGNVSISVLRKCDRMLRQAIRQWLSLPTDTPNAYFHAGVKDGGLGVSSLRWTVPLRRLKRLQKLPLAQDQTGGVPGAFLRREIEQCQARLLDGGQHIKSFLEIQQRWAGLLHNSVDGCGLRESMKVPQQHTWIQDGTRFLTGKDYLQSCKLRINALPTLSRTSRGRPKNRLCRAGCNRPETLNHVLQQCHRTHGPRIKRHDAVVNFVARALRAGGYDVSIEPEVKLGQCKKKPDIIAKLGITAIIIDAQVVNDQVELDEAHDRKIQYYQDITDKVKEDYEVREVQLTSATLSWRGVWSGNSANDLTRLGILRKKTLKVISSRVVVGGLAAFHLFNKATTVRRGGGA